LDELLKESHYAGDADLNYEKIEGAKHFYYFIVNLRGNDIYLNVLKVKIKKKTSYLYILQPIKYKMK